MTYRPPPPLRQGLASARERQKPVPQASAMIDIPTYYIVLSVAPILVLFLVALIMGWLNRERARNEKNKVEFLRSVGFEERREVKPSGTAGTVHDNETLRRRKLGSATTAPLKETLPSQASGRPLIIGFWHPYCNAGGGGERVLWTAIYWALRQQQEQQQQQQQTGRTKGDTTSTSTSASSSPGRKIVCVVYSGDYPEASKESILERVHSRFHLPLSSPTYSADIHFKPLPSRRLISDGYWRRFTLLGQSIGSMLVCAEGCGVSFGFRSVRGSDGSGGFWPDVFIDTMGNPFTLPFIAFMSGWTVPLGAYVHYPVISTDMIGRVREGVWGVESGGAGKAGEEGSGLVGWRRVVKLIYYHALTRAYAVSLLFADEIMTNSSWTSGHITSLLTLGRSTWLAYLLNIDASSPTSSTTTSGRGKSRVVFPPCDTSEFLHLPLENRDESLTLISLAQFRPEKDQAKQLDALGVLFKDHPEWQGKGVKLVLMGSCRDEADELRIEGLRRLSRELGIEPHVEFVINASFPEIVRRLGGASIGLNTMKDEHFGISVVEFMAAGLIPLAHASAGPVMDIIVPLDGQITGFHALDAQGFADQIHKALSLPSSAQLEIRRAARQQAVLKFSQECFERDWGSSWNALLGEAVRGAEERQRWEIEEERQSRTR